MAADTPSYQPDAWGKRFQDPEAAKRFNQMMLDAEAKRTRVSYFVNPDDNKDLSKSEGLIRRGRASNLLFAGSKPGTGSTGIANGANQFNLTGF